MWVNVIFYKIINAEQGYAVQECDARMLNREQMPVTKIKKWNGLKPRIVIVATLIPIIFGPGIAKIYGTNAFEMFNAILNGND